MTQHFNPTPPHTHAGHVTIDSIEKVTCFFNRYPSY